jgi:hypothetical protein
VEVEMHVVILAVLIFRPAGAELLFSHHRGYLVRLSPHQILKLTALDHCARAFWSRTTPGIHPATSDFGADPPAPFINYPQKAVDSGGIFILGRVLN